MINKGHKILIVEDDKAVGYLLSEYLKMKNFDVTWVADGFKAIDELNKANYNLAILDVMMPKMDGFTLAETIRETHPSLPFIFLSAKSLKIDVLKGFHLGAIDYLKKPIDEEELVVRIERLLFTLKNNSNSTKSHSEYRIGKYYFNSLNQELKYNGDKVKLTVKESEILTILVEQKNQLSPHKDILIRLWGKNDYFNKKSLNVFITRLRKYLELDTEIKIENVHGKGYILRLPTQDEF
ncbi:response regulator transcription factor [Maribacter sp. CXY002]|uniref:response regulator transcription factor n=1 Tax=Maribacter luteocoastalis TaxID=3407671 RepID=UPI003B674E20